MAETIPEHHPALAGSPSRDGPLAGDAADYADGAFDDSEYPFAQGVLNGAKCCSKCGATKTPQWREGPFGERAGRGVWLGAGGGSLLQASGREHSWGAALACCT